MARQTRQDRIRRQHEFIEAHGGSEYGYVRYYADVYPPEMARLIYAADLKRLGDITRGVASEANTDHYNAARRVLLRLQYELTRGVASEANTDHYNKVEADLSDNCGDGCPCGGPQ